MRFLGKVLLGCVMLATYATFAQAENKAENVPVIEIMTPLYDFGEVPRGEIVKHDYTVMNKGTAPLEIKRVKTD